MNKATSRLHVAGDVGGQRLALQSDPIDYRAFHSLGIVSPSTIGAFLNLRKIKACVDLYRLMVTQLTKSAIMMTSSSEDSISRPSSPGTIRRSSWKTVCSFLSPQLKLEATKNKIGDDARSCQLHFHNIVQHSQDPVRDKCLYVAEGVNGPAEVTPMMDQRILCSPDTKVDN